MRQFFKSVVFLLLVSPLWAQQQVSFNQEVTRIESTIAAGQFEEALQQLLALESSLENTSLIEQDTVRLFFSSKLAFVTAQLGDCQNTLIRSKEDANLKESIYGAGDPITLAAKRNLGIYYINCDSLEKSRDVLEGMLASHRSSIGQPDELYARSLDDLGYVYGALGNIGQAKKNYDELLGLLGSSKSSFYIQVIDNYSALLMTAEEYEGASIYYEDLKAAMAGRDSYPSLLKDFYNVFVHVKDYVKALDAAGALIDWCGSNTAACSELGVETEEFLLNSARLAVLLYRYDEAASYYSQAETLFEGTPTFVTVLLEEASLYGATGQSYRQLYALNKSMNTHRSNNMTDSASYRKTVLELGKIYTELGRFNQADQVFSSYISDLERNSDTDPKHLAIAYQSLGNQRYFQQNFKDADQYLLKAKNLLENEGLEASVEYASVLNSLGALYEGLASFERAESFYRQALKGVSDEVSGLRIALATNLANILTRTESSNDSIPILLGQAIEWQEISSGKDHPAYANLLSNRAVYYQENESYDEALADYEAAIKIFDYTVNEDHPQYLSALSNLGLLYDLSGQTEQALDVLQKAKRLYETYYTDAHPGYIRTVNNLANLYSKNGDYELAEPLFISLAENQVDEIHASFTYLSESEKKAFVKEKQKILHNFKGYVVSRSVIDEKSISPDVLEKWYNLELSTKGMLLNSTKKVREQIFESGDEKLIQLFSEWTVTRKQIADLQSLKSEFKGRSQERLDSLIQTTNELEKELTRRSSRFGGSFTSDRPTYDRIESKLNPGEATVEIIRTDFNNEGVYTALIGMPSKEHPELIVIGKGDEFEKKGFSVYKNAIKFKLTDSKSFSVFWEKIHSYLTANGIEKIFYAPDGIYHKISINTLYDPTTKKYLIDELDVFQISSSKDILNMGKAEVQSASLKNALLVGRPSYKLSGSSESIGSTRSFKMISNVADLPGTEKEIKEIQELMEKAGTTCNVLLQAQAGEAAVKSQMNSGLVHIATHGFFMEQEQLESADPMLNSGLLLAGVSDLHNSDEEDGVLTAYEIMNLELSNLEMVVMSACETGLGEIASGEGIYGLQRAFFVGGVQSVVMSLWKVDDEATKDLMTIFYKEYLKNSNRREAFINAQKKIKKKYKHPIFWGAFVMLGS